MPDWDGQLSVRIEEVKKEDGGVYECFYEGRRSEGVHALIRLIVRGECLERVVFDGFKKFQLSFLF